MYKFLPRRRFIQTRIKICFEEGLPFLLLHVDSVNVYEVIVPGRATHRVEVVVAFVHDDGLTVQRWRKLKKSTFLSFNWSAGVFSP